ncbi:mycothiol synthase [Allonocardiopsis opalescens]|uniref:Mycothiol acetyltransferase n=1 Tax=Allonocardiopsis opalescens TaxID=1144618 RepID=A0A2T0QAD7_9ACTN|nr:mycothiol synthase [Allonocardiopsis opalescens]PRY00785.1 mycothiol synthase [Allonocardiopsis opalescens]
MIDVRIEVHPELSDDQAAAALRLVDAATAADSTAPLSEQAALRLRYGGQTALRHILLWSGDELAGLATAELDGLASDCVAELVVHPGHRGRGHGRLLLDRLLAEAGPRVLRLWAHGRHPAAGRLAERAGLRPVRELLKMRRPLGAAAPALPEVSVPLGMRVRTFRPGADEAAWLEANARAFADHPEQGSMTLLDLRHREDEDWFDPDGFFLVEDGTTGALLGFHWTKVHADGAGLDPGRPVGEVYVVGIDPAAQGRGLGRLLTVVGLGHLRDRGLEQVLLYVEADNAPAVRLYRGLGFTEWDADIMYSNEPEPP